MLHDRHDSLPHRAPPAAGLDMQHGAGHQHPSEQHPVRPQSSSLNWIALTATLHCLSGCAVGEVLGMVIGTALGMSDGTTIALAVALAFFFGYAFTMVPLLRHGLSLRQALKLALAADTVSIAIMEITDNLIMLAIPGAMDAPLDSALFWGSLALALVIAGIVAFPANRWLIARGRGHLVVHAVH
ncbi:MAG TPA: DUF4396 domain-containing protein [Burkholderiales bacterium]|nr:DUF4396 domain-containing protein [Burkholderiales bacterium]